MSMFGPKTSTPNPANPTADMAAPGRRSIGRARPTQDEVDAANADRPQGFTPTPGVFQAECEGIRSFTSKAGETYEVLTFKTKSPNGKLDHFLPDDRATAAQLDRFVRIIEMLGVTVAPDGTYDADALRGKFCRVDVELDAKGRARLRWSGGSVGVLPPS